MSNASETPLTFDVNTRRILRLIIGWSVLVFVVGVVAINTSAVSDLAHALVCAIVVVYACAIWLIAFRAYQRMTDHTQLVCTSHGVVGLVGDSGDVVQAHITGRNLCLPGLWLLELRATRREVVIVDLNASTGWEIAMLKRRLKAGATYG